jgi:tight adherence protein C
MYNVWLALGLVGTFAAIMLVGVVVDMAVGERRRPLSLLRSQVGAVESVPNLREEELKGSAFERLLVPGGARLGSALQKLTPFDMYRRINEKIVLAGSPAGWNAERVVSLKIVFAIAGFVGGLALIAAASGALLVRVVLVVATTLIGYVAPSARVAGSAMTRQKTIQRQLPDVMDLLTISVEAGLGFDAALSQVTKNVPGPLAEEIGRLLQEVQIGVSRTEAFRHLGERTDVPELAAFVLSMIQADLFGVPIANVLRAQSGDLRLKRRQRAEEIAQKIPVKLLFPMIFLILPALFIVTLGPGAIKVYDQLIK